MNVKTLEELCTCNVVGNFDTNGAVISTYDLDDKVCENIVDRLLKAKKLNKGNIDRLQLQAMKSLKIDEDCVFYSSVKVCCWLADIVLAGLKELDISCEGLDTGLAKVIVKKYDKYMAAADTSNNSSKQDASNTFQVVAALRTLRIKDKRVCYFEQLPRMLTIFAYTLRHLDIECSNERGLAENSVEFLDTIGTLSLDTLSLRNFNFNTVNNFTVTSSMQQLKRLKLDHAFHLCDRHVLSFLEVAGQNIQYLCIRECVDITDTTLQNIRQYCPNLVKLDLSNSKRLTAAGLESFFATASLKKLQRLSIGHATAVFNSVLQNIQIYCPNLVRLDVKLGLNTEYVLQIIKLYCPNLVSLDLTRNTLTTAGLELFITTASLAKLQILNLRLGDNVVTDNVLQEIKLHCPNLISLDLSYNDAMTTVGLELFFTTTRQTKLQRLDLSLNYAVTDNVVAKLATVGNLSYINLSECPNITCRSLTVLASIPTLKYVSLYHCKQLWIKDVKDFMTLHGLDSCRIYDDLRTDDWR